MFKKQKINFKLILTILIGTAILSLTMIRSGLNYPFGIGFWGPNGHDGIWHLSLINQLQQSIPPQNPVFSGTILNNYHWGFDLFAAGLGKIIHNNSLVYFQILPIIFGLLIGIFSYQLVKKDSKNSTTALIFTFITYFTGSFGWIYTLLKSHTLGGESLFWSMQSISTLINPPFALSIIIILVGLLIWHQNFSSKKYNLAVINGIIFGLLAGVKVYAGIIIGLTLVTLWFLHLIKTKKIINYNFITWVTTLAISLVILLSLGVLQNSSLLEFKPLWFVHSMIESIDKFYFPQLAAYRMNLSQNLSIIKLPLYFAIEFGLVLIFLVGNMGFRIFGFSQIVQKIKTKKFTQLEKLVLVIMSISFIIPMLFIQKGTAWNTIQFFYYFLFFSNLFFAQKLSHFIESKQISKIIFAILILILSNITTFATVKDYLGNPPPAAIPQDEIEALNFLKSQPNGFVLTYPYDKYLKNNFSSTPIPIYAYETTAYISAFSTKTTFLEDEMNLDITGFNWENRRSLVEKFFTSNDQYFARGFLIDNQISYIYLINGQKFTLGTSQLQINKIFGNSTVQIYKVQR